MANIITSFRILFAIVMVLAMPFFTIFWICYLCGGLSDGLDGFVARKLKQQTLNGAKFDSIADIVFASAIAIVVIRNTLIPSWLWICIALIVLLRFTSYSIGFYKYHTFVALHTYANKAAGLLIFVFPLLYILFGITVTGIILCVVTFLCSVEEAVIIMKSKGLDYDCKSILIR